MADLSLFGIYSTVAGLATMTDAQINDWKNMASHQVSIDIDLDDNYICAKNSTYNIIYGREWKSWEIMCLNGNVFTDNDREFLTNVVHFKKMPDDVYQGWSSPNS